MVEIDVLRNLQTVISYSTRIISSNASNKYNHHSSNVKFYKQQSNDSKGGHKYKT